MNQHYIRPRSQDSIILDQAFHRRHRSTTRAPSIGGRKKERRAEVKISSAETTSESLTRDSARATTSTKSKWTKSSSKNRAHATTIPSIVSQKTKIQKNEKQRRRDWSRDLAKCPHSDWTIHVCRRKPRPNGRGQSWDTSSQSTMHNDKRDTYYIDTSALDTLSADRISLFKEIFVDCMEDIADDESRIIIEKNEEAARGFGILLDFLYAKSRDEEVALLSNVQRGMALYRLAEYFQLEALQKLVASFYEQTTQRLSGVTDREADIPQSTAFVSSINATMPATKDPRKLKAIRPSVEHRARQASSRDNMDSEVIDPDTLLEVLQQRKGMGLENNKVDSENTSCLVALCVEQNKEKLSPTMFYRLTSKQYMPYIDQEAALQLLGMEQDRKFWTDCDSFSSLQSRSIRSLLVDWEGLRQKFHSDELYWRALRRLSPSILGILLMHASKTTQADEELSSITGPTEHQSEYLHY